MYNEHRKKVKKGSIKSHMMLFLQKLDLTYMKANLLNKKKSCVIETRSLFEYLAAQNRKINKWTLKWMIVSGVHFYTFITSNYSDNHYWKNNIERLLGRYCHLTGQHWM